MHIKTNNSPRNATYSLLLCAQFCSSIYIFLLNPSSLLLFRNVHQFCDFLIDIQVRRFALTNWRTDWLHGVESSQGSSFIISQEICRILRNLKGHYSVYTSSPLYLIMNQMNLVYDIPFCFLKTHRNIILRFGLDRPNNFFNTGLPISLIQVRPLILFLVRNFVLLLLYTGETKIERKITPVYDKGKQN
jgi:hypothetical protein